MGAAMKRGMVLVMSIWDDHDASMVSATALMNANIVSVLLIINANKVSLPTVRNANMVSIPTVMTLIW